MDKLVTLKIGNSSDRGYSVTLEIAEERWLGDRIWLNNQVEQRGQLPPASELLKNYSDWQQSYRNLDVNRRLEANPAQITNISAIDLVSQCQRAAQRSLAAFDRWLKAESFHQIREHLAKNIAATDRVRFLLQIDDPQLYCLPWQLGEMFTKHSSTEVVLSSPSFENIQPTNPVTKSGVRILAILGNSQGINIEIDRKILENLPKAQVKFLVEPHRQELTDSLWAQNWDILFFAGHSSSSEDRTTGRISIDRTDSLSIEELRYGLKQAIANGLKIAIFNSCDGLGLAKSLADLQIPQVIVMREPIPDRVAQTFLKGFLELYSQGNSFYRSVREAREKLQGLEDKFPCATWLPTVCQHGTSHPPTWQQLQGAADTKQRQLKIALVSSLVTTIAIAATRFLGILQPLELNAFDLTMRSRPSEQLDSKILVIEVTMKDTDLQKKSGASYGSSLSDEYLNRLLNKLKPLEPRIIGIDNYLSHPIDPKYSAIYDSLRSDNFVAVCKTEGASKGAETIDRDREKPPPKSAKQFGFGDTIGDKNGDSEVMRRQLLSMDSKSIQPGSSCNADWSLNARLAYEYLYQEPQEIQLAIANDTISMRRNGADRKHQLLQPHQILRKFSSLDLPYNLTASTGGYQGFDLDDRGYQILLNYRTFNNSIRMAIPSLSLQQAMELPPDKLQQAVRDKLILIGTTDPNYGDIVKTPYGSIPGVFHQAQMTSQLINAALEHRPLFWAYPFWTDISIVFLCATTGALLAWGARRTWILVSAGGAIIAILWVGSVGLLAIFGYWLPLVPALFGLVIASSWVRIYSVQAHKVRSVNSNFSRSHSRHKYI